ncbi:hypothetical protein BSM4216_0721 [Bacillus smithii]|nr:hypothetical protein BSM4216_0721 [Bacillus smithii]
MFPVIFLHLKIVVLFKNEVDKGCVSKMFVGEILRIPR